MDRVLVVIAPRVRDKGIITELLLGALMQPWLPWLWDHCCMLDMCEISLPYSRYLVEREARSAYILYVCVVLTRQLRTE